MKAALAERLEESIRVDTEGPADGGAQAPAADLVESTEPPAASTAAANGEVVSICLPFPCRIHHS